MFELLVSTVCVDGITAITYGIKGETKSIEDVSLDKNEVVSFIVSLNENGADELHLFDLVEDFLS